MIRRHIVRVRRLRDGAAPLFLLSGALVPLAVAAACTGAPVPAIGLAAFAVHAALCGAARRNKQNQ